jgi:hypothetical protein
MYFFGGFSLISSGFRPNSTVLVPCFLEFTENTAKHFENWCPHVLIPCKKKFNLYFQRFPKSQFPMGENWRAGHLCVGKPLILALRIGMKTLKVLIEKMRTTQRWFLPAFAFEHLQHYFGDDMTDFFPHPSLVLYSFATPPIKLKSGQQIGARPWITNHVDRSSWWANLLGSSEITFNPIFSAGALHQPGRATRLFVHTHYTVTLGFRIYASSYYLTPKAPPSLSLS